MGYPPCRRPSVWLLFTLACAALVGLDELEELPDDFPLTLQGEAGRITAPKGGEQVSVDVAFADEALARDGWSALRQQALSRGFTMVEQGPVDKRERVVLEGPRGKLTLDCCPRRVDRQRLVLVSWWAP